MRKLRILYVSRDYTTHDHRFLSALAAAGQQAYYLRLERQAHDYESRALPPEVEILQWGGGKKPAQLRDGLGLAVELRNLLRKLKPDIVQAGPLQRSALLAALAGARSLVSMSWGYDLLFDAGRSRWWQQATRYTLQHSAAMVGDCDTIRRLAVSYGMPSERIVTFPWGIDLAHFSPGADAKTQDVTPPGAGPSNPFTILSTRSWEPIYGVDVIARAFALAARQRPELRLVMLGNGSQAGLLRQIFLSEGLIGGGAEASGGERVIFPGQVGFNDLPRYYRSADLYIAATHSDGTSISLLEAMACGLPVLISNIPGNREWMAPAGTAGEEHRVEGGAEFQNGWLFPDGNVQALAQAIIQAAADRERLQRMGNAARTIAEERADWNKNFPQLFRAFEIALQNP